MSENKDQKFSVLVAEAAAALTDVLHDMGLADKYYELRADHDGCTGMWSSIGMVAYRMEISMGVDWAAEKRNFIEDVWAIAPAFYKFNKEVRLIEDTEDAKEFVDRFLNGTYTG